MEQIREAADLAEERLVKEAANNPEIRDMTRIVESFLKSHRVMCYGGTAINNLLPEKDQFYDKTTDIPDYDFFSETPQLHAMKLADQYYAAGYTNIEVKPGVHLRTFKVFVNYIGMADITFLHPPIFEKLWKEDFERRGIHYVTPDYLRMSVYLELSRPRGDVSRWIKVYKRLMLLNKHYPVGCKKELKPDVEMFLTDDVRMKLEKFLESSDVILLGFHAVSLHTIIKSDDVQWKLPIDLLVESSFLDKTVQELKKILPPHKLEKHPAFAELLPPHVEFKTPGGDVLARVFETQACHSYHQLRDGLKIASIPTLLQFYFAFLYADSKELAGYDSARIQCVAQRLVDMAHFADERRFELLTPLDCLGYQPTLSDMREEKSELYTSLSHSSPTFLRLFFTYNPSLSSASEKRKLRKVFTRRSSTAQNGVQKSTSKGTRRRRQ
jgi:hypothetical protein